MPDPELLVDGGDELQHVLAPPLRHLEVEGAGDVQRLHVLDPGEGDVVIGPAAGDRDGHLVGLGPVEDPVPQRSEPLDHVEGMFRAIGFEMNLRHVDP